MRERILAEIRRLAAANEGRVPGRQVFEAETGIRYHEWYGVYWARWGDAVAEAGLAPNVMQKRLNRDAILREVALAVRHFGKMPTLGDIRIFGRSRPGFPAHSTISNAFDKVGLVDALREWVAANAEFADVAGILPSATSAPASRSARRPADGSVYLIQSGAHYKIGRSDELERRVKEIRIALPDKAVLIHVIATDDPAGIEAYWHRRFADRRANGEWFKLTVPDIAAFKRRRFQ
ncbi:GIY-YIG nuclease family protein [Bosea caraganae]|uniref:GIY-YIG nuclease family protein n=1 Tax=Bosea caraganae TaxID=2763117 RepID=A0A370LCS3_9HYPH|nr:GIY-YIG nuclease family protein [Bosea caraganae]RDJ27685.1 GIY-YIG nuclease family protein [Bosea caraganae]RDJ29698.1 GIY-YIG nuclease family protein [Bosea caraganae]